MNAMTKERSFAWVLILGAGALLLTSVYSVLQGSTQVTVGTLWDALFNFDSGNRIHLVIRDLRIPRVLSSALVGSALAVSGALMQGITGNPMADSGLMGLNAGAGAALALSMAFFPGMTYMGTLWACFAGAGVGAILVNVVGHVGNRLASPMRMVLAGISINMLLTALSQGVALSFGVSQDMMFWLVGGVSSARWAQVAMMTPFICISLGLAYALSGKISVLSLGTDVAEGLGVHARHVVILSSVLVAMLAGISVSVVGAVGFVGLMVPHVTRSLVGVDYRRIVPGSAVLGALLLVVADLGSRTLNPPFETPLSTLISLVGVPFFLYIARMKGEARP